MKTVQVWSEEAVTSLKDCSESTVWEVFSLGANLEEYTSKVLDYIQVCTETVLRTRTIKVFPDQKPWFDGNVRSLLRVRDTAFRSGGMRAYRTARRDLKKAIKKASTDSALRVTLKTRTQEHVEGHQNSN